MKKFILLELVANPIVNLAIAAAPWLVVLLLERSAKQRLQRAA